MKPEKISLIPYTATSISVVCFYFIKTKARIVYHCYFVF